MKRLLLLALLAFQTTVSSAGEPNQYLCITEGSTGFNWEAGKWVQVKFTESKYILKKADPENKYQQRLKLVWVLQEFGATNETLTAQCRSDFGKFDILHCGVGSHFSFNRETLTFGLSKIFPAMDTREPDGREEYSSDKWSGPDSLFVAHGKCSPF